MRRLVLMTLGLVVAVGFALGCGSGEDEVTSADETTSAPLTKAEFIKQADAICAANAKQRQKKIASWGQNGSKKTEGIELEPALEQIVGPALQREAEELEDLTPPKADEEKIARMIGSLSRLGKDLEELDSKNLESSTSQFQREATAYGLKDCSSL